MNNSGRNPAMPDFYWFFALLYLALLSYFRSVFSTRRKHPLRTVVLCLSEHPNLRFGSCELIERSGWTNAAFHARGLPLSRGSFLCSAILFPIKNQDVPNVYFSQIDDLIFVS